jgi:hypothetical protein
MWLHRPTGSRHTANTSSSIAHSFDGHFVPVEIRPHVGAALAARLADEPRLEIGQPYAHQQALLLQSTKINRGIAGFAPPPSSTGAEVLRN